MAKVNEGSATFSVPKQPVTRKAEAFYNPEMEYQRDITMSALRVYRSIAKKGLCVCDPLAGTGVRSMRIAGEVGGIERIVANDRNPKAFGVIKKNVKGSGPGGTIIGTENKDANMLFLENRNGFDYIDIDPFGSPINFAFNAGYALKSRSFLSCTATDTGALCGSFPATCLSRYGIRLVKTDFFKETGVRTLITAVMLELARHDMALLPVYSHSNHYFRIMGMVKRSKALLSARMKKIRFFVYCPACLYRSFEVERECPQCGKGLHVLGPLWSGEIKDTDFCKRMISDLKSAGYEKTRELEACADEIEEPFYYELPKLFRVLGISPKKTASVIGELKDMGHDASGTHFSGTGVKTNAPYPEVTAAARNRGENS